jgi:prepilin-type processing-associated H-X9-DG protein
MMWAMQNNDDFPWEGNKNDYMYENFKSDKWWANAIPPMLGQPTYRQLSENAIKDKGCVPLPPDSGSIFVDPAAKFPYEKNEIHLYDSKYGYEYQLFFCYIWNSELNNGRTQNANDDIEPVKWSNVRRTSETVLMLEMRTTNDELDLEDYEYYRNRPLLGRHRGDWKRIARRHRNGAHIVFCDGHTERVKYDWATTNKQGSRDPDYREGDWNKEGLIWNAFGPSLK